MASPRYLISAIVVLALAVLHLSSAGAVGGRTGRLYGADCAQPRPAPGYATRVDHVLRERRDVWGEALLRASGGPTYESARLLLEPLFFAKGPRKTKLTDSGAYYVPLMQPPGPQGTSVAALALADGSEIVADRANGPALEIDVGSGGRERFGSCLARLGTPRLAAGYLPVLGTSCVDGQGVRYAQESFAAGGRSGSALVSYLRLVADGRAARGDAELVLVPSEGNRMRVALPRGAQATTYVRWPIAKHPGAPVAIDRATYETARRSVVGYWERRLREGARILVPERRVLDAERALLVQDLGLTWRYSIGNPYEEFSYPEGIDVAETLTTYGFGAVARSILVTSLAQKPTRYPNWKMGQKLVGSALHYRLFRDRAFVERATPVLGGYVDDLARQIADSPTGLLHRERYSSDIPDSVYGLHSQAVVWQGLRTMSDAWRATGHRELAERATRLAVRLERGLREAVRRSERRLRDGSLFLDVRLLARVRPYASVTSTRLGSYWNLVMPYALASGLFPPGSPEARGVLRYMLLHGSRLVGLVRAGAFSLYGLDSTYPESGVNPVYGLNVARFLADNHEPDQLVLSLYGQLAVGMTRGTFVAGEAGSVAPIGEEVQRSMYLPPNGASNGSFLATLQLLLVHETRDRRALPTGVELAYSTPRAWLESGKRIVVRSVPTSFGRLSYTLRSEARRVLVSVDVPARRRPMTLRLRLRLPAGDRIAGVALRGRPFRRWDPRSGTLDLSGRTGHVELAVAVTR